MNPLLKWVGGKRRFLKLITPHISKDISSYIEPFVGSGALFFSLMNKNSVINDLNKDLIDFYLDVKKDYEKLFNEIKNLFSKSDDPTNLYYENRDKFNELSQLESLNETFEKSALFFFLNKVGFNGIFRVNSSGGFNVPVGSSKTYFIPRIEEFKAASELLSKTKIYSEDYKKIIENANTRSLIYLDPPYYPDESSKFVGYTDPRFGVQEHKEMLECVRIALRKNLTVLISNSNSSQFETLLNEILKDFKVTKILIETNRSINPTVIDKKKFKEALYVIK